MNKLAQLQAAFAKAMHDADTAQALFGSTQAGASAYANNLLHNRADALIEAFPIVRQLVGDEFFDAMARAAARVQVSRAGDLNQYGSEFPQFIAEFAPAQSLPYLADMARLDWLCQQAYYAEDLAGFDVARLAQLTPEAQMAIRFELHPSVAILQSPWPIASLWCAHQPADSADWADFPSPDQGGETALVWRDARRRVRVARLPAAPAAFLQACVQGQPFAEALECALDADMEFDLGASLQRWITDQVIIDYLSGDKV